MSSPNLISKLRDFSTKISGTSYVDNMSNPNSAASKMKASVGQPNPRAPKTKLATPFKPSGPTSNGVGVGP